MDGLHRQFPNLDCSSFVSLLLLFLHPIPRTLQHQCVFLPVSISQDTHSTQMQTLYTLTPVNPSSLLPPSFHPSPSNVVLSLPPTKTKNFHTRLPCRCAPFARCLDDNKPIPLTQLPSASQPTPPRTQSASRGSQFKSTYQSPHVPHPLRKRTCRAHLAVCLLARLRIGLEASVAV